MLLGPTRHRSALALAQLALLGAALYFGRSPLAAAALGLVALIALPAWIGAVRRSHAIADTPTARIGSAAQGYIELQGIGRAPAGLPLLSPMNAVRCLWYRYVVERRDERNRWVVEDRGESDASFVLDDDSGQCLIDPEGAELMVPRRERSEQRDRRITQWLLLPGDPIYVLGQFHTVGAVQLDQRVREDVGHTLAEWKRDRSHLLARFDADHNGEIDLDEWAHVRREAHREVRAAHQEARRHAEASVVRRPASGRPYLIAAGTPQRLLRHYRLWGAFHLLAFFGAIGGAGYVLQGLH